MPILSGSTDALMTASDAPREARDAARETDIRLDKSDVTVEPIFDECDECTNTITASYTVVVDFRTAGMTQHLGRFCEACAEGLARRIRLGLPASDSE